MKNTPHIDNDNKHINNLKVFVDIMKGAYDVEPLKLCPPKSEITAPNNYEYSCRETNK